MGKIFVRERRQVEAGAGIPRFVVVATMGTDLRLFARHFRKAELEKLAAEAESELVYLPKGEHAGEEREGGKHANHEQGGQGHGRGQGHRHGGHGTMDQE